MARNFDGIAQRFTFNNTVTKSPGSNHTIAFWASRIGNGDNFPVLFINGVINTSITITIDELSSDILYRLNSGSGTTLTTTDNDLLLNGGGWQHIACTYDGSTMRVYHNGVENATLSTSSSVNSANGSEGCMAGLPSADTNSFDGDLAECGVWTVTLSAEEIAALANGVTPNHFQTQNLIEYWPMYASLGTAEPSLVDGGTVASTLGTQTDHPPVGRYAPRS
jgi:hypothetical protein